MAHSSIQPLQNTYYLLRHGHSLANERSLIVSSPAVGMVDFGLSETGRRQIAHTVNKWRQPLTTVTRIFSSDFLRTRQTAELVAQEMNLDIEWSPSLRERWFGDFDGKLNDHYDLVWSRDQQDPSGSEGHVESVASVARRMTQFVTDLDRQFAGQTFLVVSHGDPLQILLTAAGGMELSRHRSIDQLQTAEIRLLSGTANQ